LKVEKQGEELAYRGEIRMIVSNEVNMGNRGNQNETYPRIPTLDLSTPHVLCHDLVFWGPA